MRAFVWGYCALQKHIAYIHTHGVLFNATTLLFICKYIYVYTLIVAESELCKGWWCACALVLYTLNAHDIHDSSSRAVYANGKRAGSTTPMNSFAITATAPPLAPAPSSSSSGTSSNGVGGKDEDGQQIERRFLFSMC